MHFAVAFDYVRERFGQPNIIEIVSLIKKWGDLLIGETGYSATYSGHIKRRLVPFARQFDEIINIGFDGIDSPLHSRYGVRLALNAHSLSPHGAKFIVGRASGSSGMASLQIASENKNLIRTQLRNMFLKYYQKAGDEKKIHEVYSLISAQNDSSKEQSGQKTAQSNAATDVHTQALQKISESEEEFLSELKECFSESGELSASERRLLTRLANRLGISQERAAELEKMAKTPQLTADEEAYIAEYKECLSSGGEISPSERRLLNKLALALNLSSARVKELDTYA